MGISGDELPFIDYLDLFLIHSPHSGKARRLETWKALVKAKEDGNCAPSVSQISAFGALVM